jgi:branched-chain amino acid transport system permease protein
LVTLTFGLLMDNMVFALNIFDQQGNGVAIGRPDFAGGDRAFTYLLLVVFCLLALLIVRLRHSTIGMAFAGVRWSEVASRTLGLNVTAIKVFVFAVSAFIAAIGGGMLALYYGAALSANYGTLIGLVYLAVLVTAGIRSCTAALLAGLVYSVVPALFASYLPNSWSPAPAALFGLGGILAAKQPDGWVLTNGLAIRRMLRAVARRRTAPIPAVLDSLAHGKVVDTAAVNSGAAEGTRS